MRIAVVGHTGRVGQELQSLIYNSGDVLTAGWDRQGPYMLEVHLVKNATPELDLAQTRNFRIIKLQEGWRPDDIDVVIDFSLPENFPKLLEWCQVHQKPLVSGVTGLGEINEISLMPLMGPSFKLKAPLFWSSNMSLGIALLKQFIEMAKIFGPHDFAISETHHIHKKDSPSGTALSLAAKVKETFKLNKPLAIEAVRTEEVFGIHEVTFKSDDEVVRIYHEAMNRKVFASGALKVAHWLVTKPVVPKIFVMEDFIRDVKNS